MDHSCKHSAVIALLVAPTTIERDFYIKRHTTHIMYRVTMSSPPETPATWKDVFDITRHVFYVPSQYLILDFHRSLRGWRETTSSTKTSKITNLHKTTVWREDNKLHAHHHHRSPRRRRRHRRQRCRDLWIWFCKSVELSAQTPCCPGRLTLVCRSKSRECVGISFGCHQADP